MAGRATPPFRADHVGSLLRPAALGLMTTKRGALERVVAVARDVWG